MDNPNEHHYVTRCPGTATYAVTDLHGETVEVAGFRGTVAGDDITRPVVVLGDEHTTHALDLAAARRLYIALLSAIADAEGGETDV